LSEFLPGFEAEGWNAIGAPKGTPAEIIDKLSKEINARLADPRPCRPISLPNQAFVPKMSQPVRIRIDDRVWHRLLILCRA
jgi:hypothetical protein